MQVALETTSGLGRKATITVPSASFEERIAARVKSAASDLKLPGFRPGKVPLKEVRRRFGDQLRREVANELLQSSFADAVREGDLTLAGQASIELVSLEAGRDLEYIATFEVLPGIELSPLDQLDIRRPTAEIEEADIDATVQTLREQKKEWQPVERPAAEGDRVTVDYLVKADGKTLHERTDAKVVVGGPSEFRSLGEALVGMATDETRAFPVTEPVSLPSAQSAQQQDPPDGQDQNHDDVAATGDNAVPENEGEQADPSAEEREELAPRMNAADDAHAADDAQPDVAAIEREDEAPASREAMEAATAGITSQPVDPDQLFAAGNAAMPTASTDTADSAAATTEPSKPDEADANDPPAPRQAIGQVTVHAIEEPHLPAVDDDFFEWFGVEEGDDRPAMFRAAVRERMRLELEAATRRAMSKEVVGALAAAHDFDLPEAMVQAEIDAQRANWQQMFSQLAVQEFDTIFRAEAERRTRARLVMREIVAQHDMTPDDERVQQRIDEIAGSYEEEADVRRWLYGSEEQLNRIENAVLEDQVVDHVLAQARVTTVHASYEEVIAGRGLPDLEEEDDAEGGETGDEAVAVEALEPTDATEEDTGDDGTGDENAGDQDAEPHDASKEAVEHSSSDAPSQPASDSASQSTTADRATGIAGRFRRLFGKKND